MTDNKMVKLNPTIVVNILNEKTEIEVINIIEKYQTLHYSRNMHLNMKI